MMKRLLGSTALLGALAFSGEAIAKAESPALAAPKLTISGQSTFNMWWFNQDRTVLRPENGEKCDYIGKGRGYLFTVDDARLKFDITGKTDPGMDYGFTIVIDGNTEKTSRDKTIKENYLYFGGSWGKFTMGDVDGVEDTMAFYGGDPLGGTGGFDGNFDRVVNFTTGSVHSVDLVGDTGKSTKITYQTPRWKGFQAGVSYTPRTEHLGEGKIETLRSIKDPRKIYDTHSFAGALNFINKFNNGWELALSGTFIFGEAHAPCSKIKNLGFVEEGVAVTAKNEYENARAFAFGFLNTYKGFQWGGEFGWNGDSHELKRINLTQGGQTQHKSAGDSWFIDTGISYSWGATKLSWGYYYSERDAVDVRFDRRQERLRLKKADARTHIFSTSIDQKLAPGVLVFAEYAHYDMKNKAADVDNAIYNASAAPSTAYTGTRSNKADAFVVGTKIKF